MDRIRLQKYFTDSGVMSRRKCEEAILDGRITVNSLPAELGMKVLPGTDRVFLDGREIVYTGAVRRTYIMLNKPMGYVTTAHDEKGRRNAVSLVADCGKRVYPVGRLDMYSEGLLLMTDDGELTNRMTHPSHGLTKTYIAKIPSSVNDDDIERMSEPFEIDGRMINRPDITLLESTPTLSSVKIVLSEGRNREIRRICERAGLKLIGLRRVAIGELSDDSLPLGKYRFLTPDEIEYLKSI